MRKVDITVIATQLSVFSTDIFIRYGQMYHEEGDSWAKSFYVLRGRGKRVYADKCLSIGSVICGRWGDDFRILQREECDTFFRYEVEEI